MEDSSIILLRSHRAVWQTDCSHHLTDSQQDLPRSHVHGSSRWIGIGYEYYEKGKLVKDSWQGESDLYSDKAAEPPIEGLLAVVEKGDEIQFAAGNGDMAFSIGDVKMKNFDADDAASLHFGIVQPVGHRHGERVHGEAHPQQDVSEDKADAQIHGDNLQ